MNDSEDRIRGSVRRWRRGALIAGLIGFALCLIGVLIEGKDFLESYLFAWITWWGFALGCLAWLMLSHLTGGRWTLPIRRILEAGAGGILPLALLFLPLLGGLEQLYPWTRAEIVAHDPMLQHKQAYLNLPLWLVRSAGYFAIWITLAWILDRWKHRDPRAEDLTAARMRSICALGLLLYVLTVTFASIDWVMSLEPHWYSMVYGLLFVVGQGLGGIAFAIFLLTRLQRRETMASSDQFHDLGNLLMAFVLIWAYVEFCQFLIIWYGNLAEDSWWVFIRKNEGWQFLALALIILHFALPFVLLLNRHAKQYSGILTKVAGGLLVMRFIEQFWMVAPSLRPDSLRVRWLDFAALLAIGGLWGAFVAWRLGASPPAVATETLSKGMAEHA